VKVAVETHASPSIPYNMIFLQIYDFGIAVSAMA